ncbi:MAG: UDP-N-acetylmuramate dehydrogenase, partial [Rickettsiales bacterium]|nr:UDP-N-acetylmuramate dehydrogenase [Rickettsiales bacterium]
FDVGGSAEILCKPKDINDLSHFLKNCPKDIPINILGIGSNVIIDDNGVKGVVIRLGKEFSNISLSKNKITAGSGSLCANIANYCASQGLANLEFLSGIPGSIGGAIAMNAGCYDSDISQILESVKAVDYNGNIVNIPRSEISFSYRKNNLANSYVFTEATFIGKKSTPQIVKGKIQDLQKNRQESQPIRAKTGGSTFKNPSNSSKKAWQLIDEAGYRGKIKGGAQISQKHCNFLINIDNAKAQDLIKLGQEAKDKVKKETGIELEWEIKIIK